VPPDTPLLEARKLRKVFSRRVGMRGRQSVLAVDGVSFTVGAGETVALVGESGCGKSTVGRLALGLIEPDEGDVALRGRSVRDLDGADLKRFRRSVQMVFQTPLAAFNPMLTIGGSLRDAMRLRDDLDDKAQRRLALELLDQVRLAPDLLERYPAEVSGGQLQRAGVARALASDPDVVFLDEPTSALDVSVRGQILELLADIQRDRGCAYVLVSHDIRVVQALATHVLVMYLGHVVEEGPARSVLERPLHPYTRGLLATVPGPEGRRSRVRVRGEVSSQLALEEGCRLRPRCPWRMPECDRAQELTAVEPEHRVRCWRALEIEHELPPERRGEAA
jgi:oligopeptide transport system ATP-binding protein